MANATHPQVTGSWRNADETKNTLQAAGTAEAGMIAVRSTHDLGEVVYGTPEQFHNLVKAMDSGRIPERG